MALNTPRYGFPYPEDDDAPDGAGQMEDLAKGVEADLGSIDDRVGIAEGTISTNTSDKSARVRLVAQSAQSIAHNTAVAIQFGASSEVLDLKGWHDVTTNNSRVTPNIAGWYECWGTVALGGRTDYTNESAWIRTAGVNNMAPAGKTVISTTQLNGTVMIQVPVVTVYLNGSTDYVELVVQHSNGASAAQNTALSGQFASVLEMKLVLR